MEIARVLKEGGGVQLVIAPRRMFCTAAALRLRLAIAMVTPPDQIPAEVAQMQVGAASRSLSPLRNLLLTPSAPEPLRHATIFSVHRVS